MGQAFEGSNGVSIHARAAASVFARIGGMELANVCAQCSEVFNTRNQLFSHIKKSGHAAMKPVGSGGAAAPQGVGAPATGGSGGKQRKAR